MSLTKSNRPWKKSAQIFSLRLTQKSHKIFPYALRKSPTNFLTRLTRVTRRSRLTLLTQLHSSLRRFRSLRSLRSLRNYTSTFFFLTPYAVPYAGFLPPYAVEVSRLLTSSISGRYEQQVAITQFCAFTQAPGNSFYKNPVSAMRRLKASDGEVGRSVCCLPPSDASLQPIPPRPP